MILHYRLLLFICLSLLFTFSNAQQLQHVQGEFLIRPMENVDLASFQRAFTFFEGRNTNARIEVVTTQPFPIWKLSYDHSKIHERHFYSQINVSRLTQNIQYNHLIQDRQTIPNDPLFSNQWQYINTGMDNCVEDADLDADEAWDVTTGGLTVFGDTIVVCVIERTGVEYTHEDLVDNMWRNHAEIPNNKIDDDGNGFVDDYLGWNTTQNNDKILATGANHGTSVNAIIGAVGDNNIGVTGINWKVKLMNVRGGTGVESEVLEAYSYSYGFRKKYNETNGEEGAFVVATNASWGVDYGQPEDAPIWCSFYDSLGAVGILNCGATINESVNVDEVGDLPTGCSSEYLIGVTNVNCEDALYVNAGYGATSIDLGAYGDDTYTAANGNNYIEFGGTSGATPHVTGTVALLYSIPCQSLISIAKNDPAAAALMVKDYILESVIPNQSLEMITVTEGRLNMNTAIQMAVTNCSPCPAPTSIVANMITDEQAEISWIVGGDAEQVDLRWREVGTTNWMTESNVSSPYLLTNLATCVEYEFELNAICTSEQSGFSNLKTFRTDGCCEPPNELTFSNITAESVAISWSSVLAATGGYTLRYRKIGGSWSLVPTSLTMETISNLDNCSNYEFQIRSICDTGPTSYSTSYIIQTAGCGSCTDLEYCVSNGADASSEWIESVLINTLENTSGNDEGYGDYTGFTTDLVMGESYPIFITQEYSGNPFFEYFKVWIDYDQNGEFDDATELAVDPGMSTNMPLMDTIHIPLNASFGSTRMRVSMKWTGTASGDLPPEACEENFDYGEVEDYCVTIFPNDCSIPPMDITTTDIDTTEALLSWLGSPMADAYVLNYKDKLSSIWQEVIVDQNPYLLTGLTTCTDYEVEMQTICGMDTSIVSTPFEFRTDCVSTTFEFAGELNVVVSPNPFIDHLQLEMKSEVFSEVAIHLYDVRGKLIFKEITPKGAIFQKHAIELPNTIGKGMYLLQLQMADQVEIIKVVKQ